jgi:phytoene synthase
VTAPAERGSNFFLGFLFLPAKKREALSAVYAYCRLIDDIVDSGSLSKDEARRLLDFWRAEVDRVFSGAPTHPIGVRLAKVLKDFPLPKEAFLEMIRGCEMDLANARYETFQDLESYLQGVACSVGRMSVEIFGYQHTTRENMREFARLFGYAFQMTNIIRDVGVDLELGRVYLPESDMRAAGYSAEKLSRREHDETFVLLMETLCQRTRGFYQRARNLVDFRDRPAMVPAEVMGHIYEEVLEEIRRGGYRVLYRKTSLTPWRKAGLACKAWLYCHGIHTR